MAMGSPAIAEANECLSQISSQISQVSSSNESFKGMYQEENFQKFVATTNKGTLINQQLNALSSSISEICSVLSNMSSKTSTFVSTQEELNR